MSWEKKEKTEGCQLVSEAWGVTPLTQFCACGGRKKGRKGELHMTGDTPFLRGPLYFPAEERKASE